MVIVPSLAALQVTLVEDTVALSTAGWVMTSAPLSTMEQEG